MMSFGDELKLQVVARVPSRALAVRRDGTLYLGRHYGIYRSTDDGRDWTLVTAIPRGLGRRTGEMSRLACRLLRHEVKALSLLSDGTCVASNRHWIYYARPGDRVMTPCAVPDKDQRLAPPMTITVGPQDRVLWGEYNSTTGHNLPVRLYVSDDGGRSYEVGRVFEGGSILHVHSLIYDEDLEHYWVLTGDFDHEPGIGRLSADLKDFDWVHKGEQRCRAVEAFVFRDRLIYATDTPLEANALMSLDKATGRLERLRELDGSCIYACRFGGIYALTTSVEPSPVNPSKQSSLWLSRDGENWKRVFQVDKDRWNAVYFQFGSLVLPRGASDREVILFSGQALKDIDGKAFVATLADGALESTLSADGGRNRPTSSAEVRTPPGRRQKRT